MSHQAAWRSSSNIKIKSADPFRGQQASENLFFPSFSPPLGVGTSTHTHTTANSVSHTPSPQCELRQASEDPKKTPSKTGTQLGGLLATTVTKKEYSGELGSPNCFKMEAKMKPRGTRTKK